MRRRRSNFAERIARGFGRGCEKIGILIAMAAIIGKCLLDSGGAARIVGAIRTKMGEARAPAAFTASGFVLVRLAPGLGRSGHALSDVGVADLVVFAVVVVFALGLGRSWHALSGVGVTDLVGFAVRVKSALGRRRAVVLSDAVFWLPNLSVRDCEL